MNKMISMARHIQYIFRVNISTNKIKPETNRMFAKKFVATLQNSNILVVIILFLHLSLLQNSFFQNSLCMVKNIVTFTEI